MKQTRNSKHSRKSKLSFGIKIAGMLTCIALVSVGFASWLIVNQPGEVDAGTGSITVSDAEQVGLTFSAQGWVDSAEATPVATAPSIVFGKDPDHTPSNPWLLAGEGVGNDALVATYQLKAKTTAKITSANVNISLTASDTEQFCELIADGYITAVMTISTTFGGSGVTVNPEITGSKGAYELSWEHDYAVAVNTEAVIYIEIEFGWGEKFGTKNPYEYYNSVVDDPATDTNEIAAAKLEAYTNLHTMFEIVNSLKYNLALNGTVSVG